MRPLARASALVVVLALVVAPSALFAPPIIVSGLVAMVCATELQPVQSPVPTVPAIATNCSPLESAGTGGYAPVSMPYVAGAPQMQPVVAVKRADLNSVVMLDALFNNTQIPSLWVVWFTEVDGVSKYHLRLRIANAHVTAVTNGTASGEPVESLQFIGSRYEWTLYDPESLADPEPTLGSYCWDLTTGDPC